MKRMIAWSVPAALLLAGCASDEIAGTRLDNQPPTVWLSAAPPDGSVGTYTVKMFWGGWDPDGEISRYEYLITDNDDGIFNPADTTSVPWMPVLANDSTFTFSADELVDSTTTDQVSEFTRSHTFFIRAVDSEGVRSAEPAYRSFTSRTLSPEVRIEIPVRNGFTPAELPPIATFRWNAIDYVDSRQSTQEPESVQTALVSTTPFGGDFVRTLAYLRTAAAAHEWSAWTYYAAPEDSGRSWTTPPTEFGTYIFAVRAKDEAGAVTPVLDERFNVRRVRFSRRATGPLFRVNNVYVGQLLTSSCSTPLSIIDLPAGIPIEFTLSAEAEFYGGTVAGYRYGWDIADLNDPDQWEVDYTPFVGESATTAPRQFFFGTHTFTAEVLDNSGFCSRIEVKVNVVQFTLERNLLIVDDFRADDTALAGWNNTLGRGSLPNDAEHDAFWLDMVRNLDGFDPARDLVAADPVGGVPLTTLAQYKSIVWSVYGDLGQRSDFPVFYAYVQHRPKSPSSTSGSTGKVTPNLMALSMAAGAHLLIAGSQPVQNVVNRSYAPGVRYPLIFLYELEGLQSGTPDISDPIGDQSFAYKELCLQSIDFALQTAQRRRTATQYCSITQFRRPNATSLRDDTMREAIPIDGNFPLLQLRPEAAAAGKFYQSSSQGLDSEVYNAAYFATSCQYVGPASRACFQPIYGLRCNDVAEPTYGQPVAFWTSAFADRVADVPGAIAARSVVFGFAPVFFNPDQVRPAIEHVMFDEWQLPRRTERVSGDPRTEAVAGGQ